MMQLYLKIAVAVKAGTFLEFTHFLSAEMRRTRMDKG